ncbi:hypothetical protein UC34_05005 [Pandoraea vervacti]|uniref:ESPR domain-containing protein n=1 Tax=Pandoraea vervacti TaxID=656178 RepID=A0ABM5SVL8_9BURK|nr:hypothetical protein UC34_05005 [Pandoraea vervacti]
MVPRKLRRVNSRAKANSIRRTPPIEADSFARQPLASSPDPFGARFVRTAGSAAVTLMLAGVVPPAWAACSVTDISDCGMPGGAGATVSGRTGGAGGAGNGQGGGAIQTAGGQTAGG